LNKNWWFTPDDLATLSKLTIEKYGLQFLIINQFATNPERERVIYKLFSTESTVSFDEIWQLMEGFSVNYFLERFEQEIAKDKRYQIKRYYKLFTAKLLMKKKRFKDAKQYLESAVNEMQVDPQFEKLFQARCLEAIVICNQELGEENKIQSNIDKLYSIYPQLIPFSGLQMKMHIQSNASTIEHKEIISRIKKSNIQWVERNSESPYIVTITFSQKGTFKMADCSISYNNKPIELLDHSFSYKTTEQFAKLVSNAIFNIGNDDNINEIKNDEVK
jgi:tetratricopeptide (TPR) repeat protein